MILVDIDTKARTVYIWTDAAKMNNREYKRDDKGQFAPVDSGTKGNKKKEKTVSPTFKPYQKTGKEIYGMEEIWLPEKEYDEVEDVFNSYTDLEDGEKVLWLDICTINGYALYKGVRDDNNNWHYVYRKAI